MGTERSDVEPTIRREVAGDHIPSIVPLSAHQVERLRLAGDALRESHRLAYHALHHGCAEAIASARKAAQTGVNLLDLAERPA